VGIDGSNRDQQNLLILQKALDQRVAIMIALCLCRREREMNRNNHNQSNVLVSVKRQTGK
jgi:hypothetical protein